MDMVVAIVLTKHVYVTQVSRLLAFHIINRNSNQESNVISKDDKISWILQSKYVLSPEFVSYYISISIENRIVEKMIDDI